MSKKKKLLDQRLVTEFAELRALKNKIEKWLDVVRDEFLEQIEAGAECPDGGPFLVVIEASNRASIDWKQLLFARIAADLEAQGATADAAEGLAALKIAEIEKNAPRQEIKRLVPKPNPSFAGKIVKAIVRKLDSRTARGF